MKKKIYFMKRIIICLLVAVIATGGLTAQRAVSYNKMVNGEQELLTERKFDERLNATEMKNKRGERSQQIRGDGKMTKPTPGNFRKEPSQSHFEAVESMHYTLNYVSQKSDNDDMATVTLQVIGDPWGDGTGFQLLLDKDCEMGEYFYNYGLDDNLYTQCEYKIPENASTDTSDPQMILDGKGSVEIPEGLYDFLIPSPDPGSGRIWMATWVITGEYAVIEDFTFKAGYEYIFTITNRDQVVYEPEHDVKITGISLPQTSMDLTDQEDVSISFINDGKHAVASLNLCYKVNDGATVTESYQTSIEIGGEVNYTFNTKADFSEGGLYTVEAWVDYELDLNPANNSIIGYARKPVPLALPYTENFDDPMSLITSWTILNANEDEEYWVYDDWSTDADGGYGAMWILSPWAATADDYMITDPLIMPEAGTYHLTFYAYTYSVESFRILYGTSPNPEEMEVLVDYPEFDVWEYAIFISNFEIENPGNYYFAFHYYSPSNSEYNTWAMGLDKIAIGKGVFVGIPDITFDRVLTPVSGCDMTSEDAVGAIILNQGTEPVSEFTLTYRVGDTSPVSQTFKQAIDLRESITVYFDRKVDFSAIGNYPIRLTAATLNEENVDNNEAEVEVRHFAPITELPFESDFFNETDVADWDTFINGSWGINSQFGCYYAMESGIPLISRCIMLEPDTYRFTYHYSAGYSYFGIYLTDDFYVTYGKSGTDPSTWTPLKEYIESYTEGKTVEDEVLVHIAEAGEYVFAFMPVRWENLAVFGASLSNVSEHDLRINDIISPSSLARITPAYHAEGEKTFEVIVENRGKTASESGSVEVAHNGNVLGSQSFVFTEIGEVKQMDLTAAFENLQTGPLALTFNTKLQSGIDIDMEIHKVVSDSIFAWDNIDSGFFDGVGAYGPAGLGTIYEVLKSDLLTSITLGLYEKVSDSNFGLAVYPIDDDLVLGSPLFKLEYLRTGGNNTKGLTFDVPDTELAPGKYYFEVSQLDTNNIAVAYDSDPKGYFYLDYGNMGNLRLTLDFGYIHIRPNFGKSGVGIEPVRNSTPELKLYPNPASEFVVIESTESIEKIRIYSASGMMIYSDTHIRKQSYRLDIDALASGIYFVSIETTGGVKSAKFIVK